MSKKRDISSLLTSLPDNKRIHGKEYSDVDTHNANANANDNDNDINDKINDSDNSDNGDEYHDDDDDSYNNDKQFSQGYVQGPLDPKFGQRPAFPVVIDVKNIDIDKIPSNVNEYLAQVRIEADKFSIIKKGNQNDDDDYVYYKKPTLIDIENEKSIYVNQIQNKVQSKNEYIVPQDFIDKYLKEFIKKREEYNDYRMKLFELDAIELPVTAKQWKKFIWEVSCEKSYIAQIIEEGEHVKLIVYFSKWLGINLEDNYVEWLFAILESIEDVLKSSEISVLRQLGKKAQKQIIQISNKSDNTSNNLETYWKILVIIGVFYKQRDILKSI